MNEKEKYINDLSVERYKFIKIREESWDEKELKYIYEPPEIDSLGDEILYKINQWRDDLRFEFIIEELTKLGQAPNLLYDDDGRFAITGEGFQNVNTSENNENVDMFFEFIVTAECWKETIREALYYYLDEQ